MKSKFLIKNICLLINNNKFITRNFTVNYTQIKINRLAKQLVKIKKNRQNKAIKSKIKKIDKINYY